MFALKWAYLSCESRYLLIALRILAQSSKTKIVEGEITNRVDSRMTFQDGVN